MNLTEMQVKDQLGQNNGSLEKSLDRLEFEHRALISTLVVAKTLIPFNNASQTLPDRNDLSQQFDLQ